MAVSFHSTARDIWMGDIVDEGDSDAEYDSLMDDLLDRITEKCESLADIVNDCINDPSSIANLLDEADLVFIDLGNLHNERERLVELNRQIKNPDPEKLEKTEEHHAQSSNYCPDLYCFAQGCGDRAHWPCI